MVDPSTSLARTSTDARLIAQQTSLGAVASFDTRQNITVVSGGVGPLSDAALAASLPGTLDFVLRWTGNADLNLEVSDQAVSPGNIAKGQQVAPSLPPPGASGLSNVNLGQVGIVQQRPRLSAARATLSWLRTQRLPQRRDNSLRQPWRPQRRHGNRLLAHRPPPGHLRRQRRPRSAAPASYKINAYENGKPMNLFFLGDTGLFKDTAYSGTLTGGRNDISGAIIFSPSNPYFGNNPSIPSTRAPAGPAQPAAAVPAARPAQRGPRRHRHRAVRGR